MDRLPKHECISRASLDYWLKASKPGQQIIYAEDDSGNAFANSNRDDVPGAKVRLFKIAYDAQKEGKVMLFQKHDGPVVTYVAIRVSPVLNQIVERLAKNG